MQLKYIFIPKKDGQMNNLPSNVFFSKIFKNITKESFEINVTIHRTACILYNEFFDKESNNCYLTLNFIGNKIEFTAQALSITHRTLISGSHRSDYLIVTVLDEVSEYFANRAYPLFGHFERKLRELVYHVVIKAFGKEWVSSTNMLKNNSKEKISEKQIQNGLGDLTLFELEEFLYAKYPDLDISDAWDKSLSVDNLKSMNNDEIIEKAELFRPKSLWDRIFSDETNIDDLQIILQKIRKYRNAVAHSKEYSADDYKSTKTLISPVIVNLEHAILVIEKRIFSVEDRLIISGRLVNVIENIDKLQFSGANMIVDSPVLQMSDSMRKLQSSIAKMIVDSPALQMSDSMRKLRLPIAKMIVDSPALQMSDSMRKLQSPIAKMVVNSPALQMSDSMRKLRLPIAKMVENLPVLQMSGSMRKLQSPIAKMVVNSPAIQMSDSMKKLRLPIAKMVENSPVLQMPANMDKLQSSIANVVIDSSDFKDSKVSMENGICDKYKNTVFDGIDIRQSEKEENVNEK